MKRAHSGDDDLYSEDVFWVLFDYEVTRSQRYPGPLTLIQIEMSPSASDPVMLSRAGSVFSSELNSHLRAADISTGHGRNYRVLLPTTDEHGGRVVCERLLSVFRNRLGTRDANSFTFTVNIGMTSHPGGESLSTEDMLGQVEKALQRSRLKGSNTYVASSDL